MFATTLIVGGTTLSLFNDESFWQLVITRKPVPIGRVNRATRNSTRNTNRARCFAFLQGGTKFLLVASGIACRDYISNEYDAVPEQACSLSFNGRHNNTMGIPLAMIICA